MPVARSLLICHTKAAIRVDHYFYDCHWRLWSARGTLENDRYKPSADYYALHKRRAGGDAGATRGGISDSMLEFR
jgi:hypothetical protein